MNSLVIFLFLGFLFVSSCSQVKRRQKKSAPTPKKSEVKKKHSFGPSWPKKQKLFVDRTSAWGLAGKKAVHLYAVDFNGDGFQDLVLLPDYYSAPEFLIYKAKVKKFVPFPHPFKEIVMASFLSFHDFNKDGILDVLVGVLNQKTELSKFPLRLFLGSRKGSRVFYKEKIGAFPKRVDPTSSVAVFDFDMDGQLDIYAGNWFDYSKKIVQAAPDRLYKGNHGQFKDHSFLLKGEHEYSKTFKAYLKATPTFGVMACDIDQNGYTDVLVASSSGFSNKMWLNLPHRLTKGRQFKDKAKESKLAHDEEGGIDRRSGGNTFYAICSDYNNDGAFDVAMGELFHSYDPETVDRSSILTGSRLESPPLFLRTEYHKDDGTGAWSQGDRRASWMDYNFDGLLDLIVDNTGFPPKSRLILFHQESDHAFVDKALDYGIDLVNPSGTVVLDVDRDGRQDLIVGQTGLRNSRIDQRIYAFHNQVPFEKRKSFVVKLRGRKAVAYGEGATLILRTNRKLYRRVNSFSYGYLNSQNEEGVIFGLEKGEIPLTLRVRWPFHAYDRQKRSYPLVKNYDLKSLKMTKSTTLYLCDNGRSSMTPSCF